MADETKTPVPATKKKPGEKPANQTKLDSGTVYTAH